MPYPAIIYLIFWSKLSIKTRALVCYCIETMPTLLFPGARVNVPDNARFEMFPDSPPAEQANVEYYVGGICFVVKQAVIEAQPDCFFAVQLKHTMSDGIAKDSDSVTKVHLKESEPLLYPLAFAFMNQLFVDRFATIPIAGLTPEEVQQVNHFVHEYLAIKGPSSLLFKAHSICFNPVGIKFHTSGRLDMAAHPFFTTMDQNGVITCHCGPAVVRINLRAVPIQAPWPKSLVGNEVVAMVKSAYAHARAAPCVGSEFGDALPPTPETDDNIMPYPYPVDFVNRFFIPATAIICYLGSKRVCCEGVYNCDTDSIRIDALDLKELAWLYLEIRVW